MLNKRRYSSEIAVFDISTVILHNTFTTMLKLPTVNGPLCMCVCIFVVKYLGN